VCICGQMLWGKNNKKLFGTCSITLKEKSHDINWTANETDEITGTSHV